MYLDETYLYYVCNAYKLIMVLILMFTNTKNDIYSFEVINGLVEYRQWNKACSAQGTQLLTVTMRSSSMFTLRLLIDIKRVVLFYNSKGGTFVLGSCLSVFTRGQGIKVARTGIGRTRDITWAHKTEPLPTQTPPPPFNTLYNLSPPSAACSSLWTIGPSLAYASISMQL